MRLNARGSNALSSACRSGTVRTSQPELAEEGVLSIDRNRRKAESVTIANRLLNSDPVLFAVGLAGVGILAIKVRILEDYQLACLTSSLASQSAPEVNYYSGFQYD
jgi:hypothetical protein